MLCSHVCLKEHVSVYWRSFDRMWHGAYQLKRGGPAKESCCSSCVRMESGRNAEVKVPGFEQEPLHNRENRYEVGFAMFRMDAPKMPSG